MRVDHGGISRVWIHLARDGSLGLLMYGWTRKYALALLCVISGFPVAMKYESKDTCDVGSFAIVRYFRMMLLVMVCNLLFDILRQALGEQGFLLARFWFLFLIDLIAAYVVYYLSEVKLYKAIVKRFLPF